jgi:carbamoyl-phosphate synthase large subunit
VTVKRNVLVVSAGKWVGMVEQLRKAMTGVQQLRGGRLIVADMCSNAPAAIFADEYVKVCPISHPRYIDELLVTCRSRRVRVLIPLIDMDLERVSPHLDEFEHIGTTVVCPSEHVVATCLDKMEFARFAMQHGLPTPRCIGNEDLAETTYPVFYKPKRGFGSRRCGICDNYEHARELLTSNPDLLFQEFVEAPEVSVDGFVSRRGYPTVCVPRMRDKVVGGEAYQSHTVDLPQVHGLALKTMHALARIGYWGPVNIQAFAGASPSIIEVNSRLGSASVLALTPYNWTPRAG